MLHTLYVYVEHVMKNSSIPLTGGNSVGINTLLVYLRNDVVIWRRF